MIPDFLLRQGFSELFLPGLESLGFDLNYVFERIGRVVAEHKDALRIASRRGEIWAKPSGRLLHQAMTRELLPTVGDFVVLKEEDDHDANWSMIEAVLPRRTSLIRKAAGRGVEEQVIAANINTVFIVNSLNLDLNDGRIERYVAAVWASGALPVVILSKADLCLDPDPIVRRVRASVPAVDVLALSVLSQSGLQLLAPYLVKGETVAFVGSSGVGKSTLCNALIGLDKQATQEIGDGLDKGRHTTTSRNLFFLPTGAMVVDTPGMREFQPWDASEGIDTTFSDILALADDCRYRDCLHQSEPDCAVQAAIASGDLKAERWQRYLKLQREHAWLARQNDVKLAQAEKQKWKQITKTMRQKKKGF